MPNLVFTQLKKAAMDHLFLGTGAVCKIALFTSAWNPTAGGVTAYSATNEASGAGYTAGGVTLANVAVAIDGTDVRLTFTNPAWTSLGAVGSPLTYRYALLYRSDLAANNARILWDLGADRPVASQPETLEFGMGENAPLSF